MSRDMVARFLHTAIYLPFVWVQDLPVFFFLKKAITLMCSNLQKKLKWMSRIKPAFVVLFGTYGLDVRRHKYMHTEAFC